MPSGASTGTAEALELRDGDPARYRGLGCRAAVANVNGPIGDALGGRDIASQTVLDRTMLDLDGTANKSCLGANAIPATSSPSPVPSPPSELPLYRHFASSWHPSSRLLRSR